MEKLIITVAGDSRTSYPHNNLCPPQEDIAACAQQYVDSAKAGAAISPAHQDEEGYSGYFTDPDGHTWEVLYAE
jgi:hypothetical protein